MPPTTRTRRGALLLAAAAASVLLTSACSGAAAPSGGDVAAAPGKDDKLTLTVYSQFTDREYGVVTAGLNKLKAKFPNIEIQHEGVWRPICDDGFGMEEATVACRHLGFTLLGAHDFEYPPGHPLRCNDWRLDLRGAGGAAS